MADKPILFSGPMVRALLAGTKTQTRRTLKFGSEPPVWVGEGLPTNDPARWAFRYYDKSTDSIDLRYLPDVPRIVVGDRLYVREHWRTFKDLDAFPPRDLICGDGLDIDYIATSGKRRRLYGKFRQGMHMPRWASRITLAVTDVRVERLQDISEDDALAEGVERLHHGFYPYGLATFMTTFVDGKEVPAQCCRSARDSYMLLWDSINGRGAWQQNPWVAAYTFTVHLGNIDQMSEAA